jgi:hypothetical protein
MKGEESIQQHRIGLAPPATHAKTIPVPAPHFSSSLYAPLAQTEEQVSDSAIHPKQTKSHPSLSCLYTCLVLNFFEKKREERHGGHSVPEEQPSPPVSYLRLQRRSRLHLSLSAGNHYYAAESKIEIWKHFLHLF